MLSSGVGDAGTTASAAAGGSGVANDGLSGPANQSEAASDGRHRAPLRVGGVPEHFNIPWHLAQEHGYYAARGVDVQWVSQPLGTGQMIKSLRDGDVDVVVALTEGLVLDIAKASVDASDSSGIRLIGTFVESPLTWAISTGGTAAAYSSGESPSTTPSRRYTDLESLKGSTFGVSRLTSGSHLMAFCFAQQRGWDVASDIHFAIEGESDNSR